MTPHCKNLQSYARCWLDAILRRESIKYLEEQGWARDPASLDSDPWFVRDGGRNGNMPLSILMHDKTLRDALNQRFLEPGFLASIRRDTIKSVKAFRPQP